jgi:hypothetical protein
MSETYESRLLPVSIVVAVGVIAGLATFHSLQLALILVACGIAVACLSVSPAYWMLAAIACAVVLPGVASIGAAPGFVSYLHFPLVFIGFALAGIRYEGSSRFANSMLWVVGMLALVCGLSTLFAGAEPVRGAFSFALLAEPVVLLATIAMTGLAAVPWRYLRNALLAMILIQIPVAYAQAISVGPGSLFHSILADHVKGTLGVIGGADSLAAIAVIGGLWLIAVPNRSWRVPAIVLLLALPFIAAVNKVALLIPAIIAAAPSGARIAAGVRVAIIGISIIGFLAFANLLPGYVLPSVEHGFGANSGKREALDTAWHAIDGSVNTLAFGAGPASTVSGAAYLSTDPLAKEHSPIAALHIAPSQTALDLGALEPATSSFTRPRSSLFGTLGDLGLVGLAVYLSYLVMVLRRLYKRRNPESAGAVAGMFVVIAYGFISTGWELPAVTLFVAGLTGLALVRPPGEPDPD